MIREYKTVNTFTRTPVPAQIITYAVFLGQALTFFICMFVNFTNTVKQITILILYLITMIVQVYLSIMTSCSDPSDSLMIDYRNNPKQRQAFNQVSRNNLNVDNCLYCQVCASYVKQNSRHCKVCQRCVQNFDHHCMWVNNCVGQKNYNLFLSMTITTLINLLVYIVGIILLWTENQWQNYLGSMITLWIFSFIVVIICVMLMNLIGLHFYLIYKGMTTYQFIILQREEQKRKKQQEEERQRELRLQNNKPAPMVSSRNKNKTISFRQEITAQNEQRQPPKIQQVQMISEQIIRQHQNSADVIFGQQVQSESDQNQQKTQKSQQISRRNIQNIEIEPQTLTTGQNLRHHQEDSASLSTKREVVQNVSEFFTKNKSLKFFIGDEVGSKPLQIKSSKTVNVKQKLYQSARPSESRPKATSILNKSSGNEANKYVSARR